MISEYGVEVLENRINVHSENRDKWDAGVKLIEAATVIRWLQEDWPITSKPTKTAPVPSSKSYLHSRITKELNAIYVAKNSDYGDAFGETYKKLGIISAVTRITDKVNRLQSLSTGNEAKVLDEKIEDTAMDLANYAIMLLIEMRGGVDE